MGEFSIQIEKGKIVRCSQCSQLQIEFGNIEIEVDICKFWTLLKFVNRIKLEPRGRDRILLPLAGKQIYSIFTQPEFLEFKRMLHKTRDYMQKEFHFSQGNFFREFREMPDK